MTDATRRGFLAAAGAGTVTAAAVAAGGAAAAAPTAGRGDTAAGHDLVAHVADARSGKVSLLIGEHEVVVHDRDLVARLTRAAGR
ncbi:MAG TPA: hypothetical protein VFJ97_01755 [Dermatophilaceae bacterium]|nr:hypothetical protein [Dermatophilaceae bacterium]